MKRQTFSNQFSSSLIWSTQPVILAVPVSHARTDSFLMAVIIIKWSLMTADNPHMQPSVLDSLGGGCLLMHCCCSKHIQMCLCGRKPQTPLRSRPLFRCMLVLNVDRLAYGNCSTNFFSTGPPVSNPLYLPPLQRHSVKGQAVLVWWWWLWVGGGGGGVTALWGWQLQSSGRGTQHRFSPHALQPMYLCAHVNVCEADCWYV